MGSEEGVLGAAFAEHLRQRSRSATLQLCRALSNSGDERRAGYLHAFAAEGAHRRPADWWSPQALCHVGLVPPPVDDMPVTDLWFDPLDATWSLAAPMPQLPGADSDYPKFFAWFPVERVTDWQLAGVHEIAPDAPPNRETVSADGAWRYCEIVGKNLTGWSAWSLMAEMFGMDTVLRLWGDSPGEIGLGGQTDEDAHVFRRTDLPRLQEDRFWPIIVDVSRPMDIRFRAYVPLQAGLGHGDLSLERTWHW